MHAGKQSIRETILRHRDALSADWVAEASAAIRERLWESSPYTGASCISCYASKGNEVNTHDIIQQALAAGRRVAVPLCRKGRRLVHRSVRSLDDLAPSQFGLLEPTDPSLPEVDPSEFDLVLVPGLAFDRAGNRIGFGAGYYDGFMSRTAGMKVGLAYDFQVLDRVPAEPHDVSMNAIVTESQFHHCRT